MTDQQRNELIARAALAMYVVGDCNALYESAGLYNMSSDEMDGFLNRYSATIGRVAAELFQTVVDKVVIDLP